MKRRARWILLVPAALLCAVVLMPPPDDFAFLREGGTPIPAGEASENRGLVKVYAKMRGRERAWSYPVPAAAQLARIRALLPSRLGWSEVGSGETTETLTAPTGKKGKERVIERSVALENMDTGTVVLFVDHVKPVKGTTCAAIVHEPKGLAAAWGRIKNLGRRIVSR